MIMFANRHVHDVIGAYIYDALTPEETRQVRDHLEQCAECREDMESQTSAISCVPNTSRSLTELDKERIRWSVLGAVRREPTVRAPFWGIVRGLSAAAAVACIFAAGIFVGARLVGPPECVSTLRPANPTATNYSTKPMTNAPIQVNPAPKPHDNGEHVAHLPVSKPRHWSGVGQGAKHSRESRARRQIAALESPVRETATGAGSVAPPRPARTENVAMAYTPAVTGGSVAVPTSDNDVSPILLTVEGN
jgi:hypothetical protein